MVRGFDQSIREMFRSLGPNTIYLAKMSVVSFSSGAEFRDLIMRRVRASQSAGLGDERIDEVKRSGDGMWSPAHIHVLREIRDTIVTPRGE